ncbi:MAG: hypothetical protein JWQ51_173 [Tardiphaga sp.]|nr:hypothetical protein [Tardiphaga sp.]
MLEMKKARPESHAHSDAVLPDKSDTTAPNLTLQVSCLRRRYAVSAAVAVAIAPIVFQVRS